MLVKKRKSHLLKTKYLTRIPVAVGGQTEINTRMFCVKVRTHTVLSKAYAKWDNKFRVNWE